MEYTVKTVLGFFIGVLNLIGLAFTLTALYAVSVIARMPRTSSIYIMAATNLTIDVIQLLFGLVYLAPSIVLESFLLPGGREGQPVILLGSIFMCCWYYGSIAQMLVAVNRLIVVCFPHYDIFTNRRVYIMMIALYPLALGLSVTAQYILPCCNFSFNHIVLSYTYLEIPNVFNYSNAYIDLWMNSLSSGTCFVCYAAIIIYVRRMNKVSGDSLNAEQRNRRRMKEYRYALQFSAISLFYFFAWTFFRVFPKYITSEDSLNWFSVIAICVAINCSANALIYLFSNVEVQNVIKSKIFRRGSVHFGSEAHSHHSTNKMNSVMRSTVEPTVSNQH